jgi:hypothetical protein
MYFKINSELWKFIFGGREGKHLRASLRQKVSKFLNEFMRPSLLSKFEPKIVRISAL